MHLGQFEICDCKQFIATFLLTDHQAPTPKSEKERQFRFDVTRDPTKGMFANPEYFDTDSSGRGSCADNCLDLKVEPVQYYNDISAFGSDSSARDSVTSV